MTTEATTEGTVDIGLDPTTLALLRNDLRGLTKTEIGRLVASLTERMGIDPALAPIDLIPQREKNPQTGRWEDAGLAIYINARGASELDKRWEISDVDLDIDIRDRVVIVKCVKATPDGRTKRNVGASAYDPERPDTLARAIKTATTSAHRRTTLALVGIYINEPGTGTDGDA